jgi:hypothetical protein
MKQTTLRTLLAAAVIAAAAPQASAGSQSNNGEVTISGNYAYGDMHDVRHSPDDEASIGCSVEYDGVSDKYQVRCVARDKNQVMLSCSTYRPGFVTLVAGAGDYAFIRFTCQGPNLNTLKISKSSDLLP